jgi:elongation factor G
MGELHLEVLTHRMIREFNVAANIGKPQVAYRETIAATVRDQETLDRQLGGKRQYAQASLLLRPLQQGQGLQVDVSALTHVPPTFIEACRVGALSALSSGVLGGFPVTDVCCDVVDVSFDEKDSTEIAFKMVVTSAIRRMLRQANPMILEPEMEVEVVSPEEYTGSIISDIQSRNGKITKMESRVDGQVLTALVPLRTMFGYLTALRSASQGRASYSMQFHTYNAAPKEIQQKFAPQVHV